MNLVETSQVRLVRFEVHGSRILTGIVNNEEEPERDEGMNEILQSS